MSKPSHNLSVEATEENFNLLRAADIIEYFGWTSDHLEDARGRLCVAGALNMAQWGESQWMGDDYPLGFEKLKRFLRRGPVVWNNLHCSGEDECAETLRACARWPG